MAVRRGHFKPVIRGFQPVAGEPSRVKKTVREILIEVNESDLQQIEAVAEVEGRSRRAQIRMIITAWVKREMAKLESGTREGKTGA